MTITLMIDNKMYTFDKLNVLPKDGCPTLQMILDDKIIGELFVSPGQTLSIDFKERK